MTRSVVVLLAFVGLGLSFAACHVMKPPWVWDRLDSGGPGNLVYALCDEGTGLSYLWGQGIESWDHELGFFDFIEVECGTLQYYDDWIKYRFSTNPGLPTECNDSDALACPELIDYYQTTVDGRDEVHFRKGGVRFYTQDMPTDKHWIHASSHEFGHLMSLDDHPRHTCDVPPDESPTLMGNTDPLDLDPHPEPCYWLPTVYDVHSVLCEVYYRTTGGCPGFVAPYSPNVSTIYAAAGATPPQPFYTMCGSSDSDSDVLPDTCDPFPNDPDSDDDGYDDGKEYFMGTDILDNCSNSADHAAWPPDFDNNKTVNIVDVGAMRPHMGATSGQSLDYDKRFDLNADASIDIIDVGALRADFLKTCV